jgi:hypothetical protein
MIVTAPHVPLRRMSDRLRFCVCMESAVQPTLSKGSTKIVLLAGNPGPYPGVWATVACEDIRQEFGIPGTPNEVLLQRASNTADKQRGAWRNCNESARSRSIHSSAGYLRDRHHSRRLGRQEESICVGSIGLASDLGSLGRPLALDSKFGGLKPRIDAKTRCFLVQIRGLFVSTLIGDWLDAMAQ